MSYWQPFRSRSAARLSLALSGFPPASSLSDGHCDLVRRRTGNIPHNHSSLLALLLLLLPLNAAAQARPSNYSSFNTSATTATALAALIQGTNTDYIWMSPGTYVMPCPLVINRTGTLYLHGASAMQTILLCSNPTQPLFKLTSAALVNMTGFSCWPNQASLSTTNAQCMVTSNFASTIVEMYDLVVQNAKIEIDGPGSYRLQAVDMETGGQTDSAITLNNSNADLFLWGTGGGGGASLTSGSADYAFVWQKQGCLRAYGGTTEGQLGNGDYRIETPCTLRSAHVIANDRSEGNNGGAGVVPLELSSLVYVPPGAGAVNIALKDNGGAWLGPTNTCSLVKYNGTGALWLLGNVMPSGCGRYLVTGTAPNATIVALGNTYEGGASGVPFNATGATIYAADNLTDNNTRVGGNGANPLKRWAPPQGAASINVYQNLSSISGVPQDFIAPTPLSRPAMPSIMPGLTNVKASPYNATGNGMTDDTAAIRSAFDASCTNHQPPHLYFPAGTYRITDTIYDNSHLNPNPACNVSSVHGYGGAIFGAGSATTIIALDAARKKGVFQTDGLRFAVVSGITFQTWPCLSGDPQNANVEIDNGPGSYGGDSGAVSFYDTVINGGYVGQAQGAEGKSADSCNIVQFGGTIENACIAFASGHQNAIANGPYGVLFQNNYYNLGTWSKTVLTGTASSGTNTTLRVSGADWPVNLYGGGGNLLSITGGTDSSQVRTITSNTANTITVNSPFVAPINNTSQFAIALDTGPEMFAYNSIARGTKIADITGPEFGQSQEYFYNWTTDAPLYMREGWTSANVGLFYENSTLNPQGTNRVLFFTGGAGGPIFLYTHLSRSGIQVGQGTAANSFALLLNSTAPDWASAITGPSGVVDSWNWLATSHRLPQAQGTINGQELTAPGPPALMAR